MFHKPAGCITARSDPRHKTVLDYFCGVNTSDLFPVGRLDKDTEGLLLLTNDGQFDQSLMHPKFHVAKTYYFYALGFLDETKKDKIENGVMLIGEEKPTKPAKLLIERNGLYEEMKTEIKQIDLKHTPGRPGQEMVTGFITITEGKKHQVKRMLKAVGCSVVYLKRTAIGNVILDPNLKAGKYRELTAQELEDLSR